MSSDEYGSEIDEQEPRKEGEIVLPAALEALKGDNPTIWGIDYYKVIYMAVIALCCTMLFLYTVFEDPALK